MEKPAKKRRLMKVVLVASLALNVAVIAAVAGIAWRMSGNADGPSRTGGMRGFAAPYVWALDKEDRHALRSRLEAAEPKVDRGGPRREQYQAVLEALRAAPFEADAVAALLSTQRAGSLAAQDTAQMAWLERVSEMNDEERAAYAERLEKIISKPRRKRTRKN
ncbi:periplasmic heavy metal sensor [Sulfitobacter sp. SK012]|uniref:periplasmic heavy metal sensor n=1 Tax=Sulfitobacter sp. SK012 TaxID=1389005 RepID=UPI0013B3FEF0|nr:periplasmic heavy metal sensor [Sulfitobacter sp. SK012]